MQCEIGINWAQLYLCTTMEQKLQNKTKLTRLFLPAFLPRRLPCPPCPLPYLCDHCNDLVQAPLTTHWQVTHPHFVRVSFLDISAFVPQSCPSHKLRIRLISFKSRRGEHGKTALVKSTIKVLNFWMWLPSYDDDKKNHQETRTRNDRDIFTNKNSS